MFGLVIPAFGRLVEVDILGLLRFPCPGVGICHTIIRLGLMMVVKEIDLNQTLGITERRKTDRLST